jgi:7-cyano-7-deazaguanine synthase
MKTEKYDLVLLFSGGYDSTLLLKLATELQLVPYCVLINYGQNHIQELDYAKVLCFDNLIDWRIVSVNLPTPSNLTSEAKTYEGVSPWHVPARNLIFIAIAASIAEGLNIPLIWYGANYEDREHLFPDCYQEWVFAINKILEINGSMVIKVEAPLLGMSKDTIKKLAFKYNITNEKVFSGYGEK